MSTKLLVQKKIYLESGIHIGMKRKSKDMKKFIYKIRPDGLAILDLKKIDERIKVVAKFLARSKKLLVASRKAVAKNAIEKFGEVVGAKVVTGRFPPGMLTNPHLEIFYEPDVVFIVDPITDDQALDEAIKAKIPVVSICDSASEIRGIDLVIPANNRSRKSLAFLFWLLAREILKERGEIKTDKEYKLKIKDFA